MIQELQLLRAIHRPDGVAGIVVADSLPICLSMERPWLNNQIGISCIPTGVYVCRRVESPKFGWTFEVTNVSGRTAILFHRGNIDDDSHGCIVLGEQFNIWEPTGQLSLASSDVAFTEFMRRATGSDKFQFTVRDIK